MAIIWNQLPLEMKEAVVKELDARSRLNLAMCSKSENQLVRRTKYGKVKRIVFDDYPFQIADFRRDNGGSKRCLKRRYNGYQSSNMPNWRQRIWNIMSVIGTRLDVEYLRLEPGRGFEELFKWFRSNFHIKPRIVEIDIGACFYDESIFDWPSNTKIELRVTNCRLPNLDRVNAYDKIVKFHCHMPPRGYDDSMTDEELKNAKNAKNVYLTYSDVTMNGFSWWIKNWLTRKDDNEQYTFETRFYECTNQFNFGNITNKLSDVIGNTERCFDEERDKSYWKIDIMKNGKVGGTIKLFYRSLYFESESNSLRKK